MSTEKKHYELDSNEQALIDSLRAKSRDQAQRQADELKGSVDIDLIGPNMSREDRAKVIEAIKLHYR